MRHGVWWGTVHSSWTIAARRGAQWLSHGVFSLNFVDNHEDWMVWRLFSFPRTFSLQELCLRSLNGAVSKQKQRKKCCARQSLATGGWFSHVLSGPQQNRDRVMREWCLEHGRLAAVVSHVLPGPCVVFFTPHFLILGSSLDKTLPYRFTIWNGSDKKSARAVGAKRCQL